MVKDCARCLADIPLNKKYCKQCEMLLSGKKEVELDDASWFSICGVKRAQN